MTRTIAIVLAVILAHLSASAFEKEQVAIRDAFLSPEQVEWCELFLRDGNSKLSRLCEGKTSLQQIDIIKREYAKTPKVPVEFCPLCDKPYADLCLGYSCAFDFAKHNRERHPYRNVRPKTKMLPTHTRIGYREYFDGFPCLYDENRNVDPFGEGKVTYCPHCEKPCVELYIANGGADELKDATRNVAFRACPQCGMPDLAVVLFPSEASVNGRKYLNGEPQLSAEENAIVRHADDVAMYSKAAIAVSIIAALLAWGWMDLYRKLDRAYGYKMTKWQMISATTATMIAGCALACKLGKSMGKKA